MTRFQYSRGDLNVLPGGKDDLENLFTDIEDAAVLVAGDDSGVIQTAAGEFAIFLFKDDNSAIRNFSVSWEGQSTLAPVSSIVHLQIYNITLNIWKTIDSNNQAAADTAFTMSSAGPESGDSINDFFESGNVITCRVFQEVF